MLAQLRSRLLALYRRVLGEPEREGEVYLGFALFFGGLALGTLGLASFLWGAVAYDQYTPVLYRLREVAIVLAMLGLPAFVLSLVVLLPVDRRARIASGAGVLLTLVAAGVFVWAYPANWNVAGSTADYSTQGIAIYAAGLAVLAASSGAALVAHRLEHARATGDGGAGGGGAPGGAASAGSTGERDGAEPESVTEAQVQQDIEDAVEAADLTWGGVERDTTRRLTVETDEPDIDRSGLDADAANTARSEGDDIDAAVEGLRNLQGGDLEQGTGDAVDEQAVALQELRERRDEEEVGESTVIDRIRERFSR